MIDRRNEIVCRGRVMSRESGPKRPGFGVPLQGSGSGLKAQRTKQKRLGRLYLCLVPYTLRLTPYSFWLLTPCPGRSRQSLSTGGGLTRPKRPGFMTPVNTRHGNTHKSLPLTV